MARSKYGIFILTALLILSLLAFSSCRIQTADEYYNQSGGASETVVSGETVSIAIRCDTLAQNYDKLDDALKDSEYAPKDGVILDTVTIELSDGDTVFSILEKAAKSNKIILDYSGGASVYIKGVNGLSEFSCGKASGWIYQVNGETKGVGCDKYYPRNGDEIVWHYTCNNGKDISKTSS